jgi:hypothetical protein
LGSTSSDFSTQYSQLGNYELYGNIQVKLPNSSVDINYPSGISANKNAAFYTDLSGEITDKNRDLLTGNLVNSNQSVVNTAATIAQNSLEAFFSQPNFSEKMQIPFGDNFDREKLFTLAQDIVNEHSEILQDITILPDNVLKNANGAFNLATGSIYLSNNFVTQNNQNPNAIANVLLEEAGHSIDSKINAVDAPGDEGEIFALISQGAIISPPVLEAIKNEDDRTFINLNNQVVSIEQSGGGNENRSTLHNDIIDAASKTRVAPNVNEWDEADIVIWKTPIFGNPNYIHEFKEQWVDGYKDVIKTAARKFDLPELLLGGVAYNEVGGDPSWIDDVAYKARKFDHMADPYLENLTITSEPELTSFGNLSIQVRRASQTLGYQPGNLDSTQEQIIIDSLKDPRQNIFIAAAHLAELRDIDFKGKNADQMGPDEIKLTATRYNWGPDLSLEDIKKDTSYGDTIINKETIITESLREDNLDGAVFA